MDRTWRSNCMATLRIWFKSIRFLFMGTFEEYDVRHINWYIGRTNTENCCQQVRNKSGILERVRSSMRKCAEFW